MFFFSFSHISLKNGLILKFFHYMPRFCMPQKWGMVSFQVYAQNTFTFTSCCEDTGMSLSLNDKNL